jgi:thiamine transport system substrate-binding protein
MTPAARLLGAAPLTLVLVAGASTVGAQSPAASPAVLAPVFTAETVTLQTHDSFALSEGVLDRFTAQTGVRVEVLQGGDAGTVVNQAILAGDRPLADVLFGVDTTFLSRALGAGIFEPYQPAALADVPADLATAGLGIVTPIDYGDVCINLDLAAFGGEGQPPLPQTLLDLTRPEYRGMLVVQDPGTSSPGLAFLLATIAAFGEGDTQNPAYGISWQEFWTALRANEVEVASDWSDAYFGRFSGGANEGDNPMVVSYASSPVAEVIYADPRPETAPTGVLEDGCFRQVEFAGVLKGTDAPAEARALIDFLLSPEVQADIPLNMFVSPALATAEIPADYTAFAATPDAPLSLDPAAIDANREAWIEAWTQLVLR